ncbi:hypothetical protein tinsulaeT_30220 [Thalassotalea insulae]|uniref:Phosphoserine phosphatase n=1 Tax=Thalassotalea insulae TaxID=2056778 RepID=A0ABQ6GYM2_9GAMM|nr:phosphoserine phosphatase SerB [Thalassotalea insulae]GLX79682.1 hypothetical protein tinsulaeT_30220 [Thalassotalea insulae]
MSTAVNNFPLTPLLEFTLAQVIAPQQPLDSFPLLCQLTPSQLTLSSQCLLACSTLEKHSDELVTPTRDSAIELVVFSDISIKQLIEIISQCQLTILAINAINHRNAQISYRFNVQCQNLTTARAQLATLALNNQFEAALLKDAPELSSPGVLVMDMDSTTIAIECIDEIAALAGVGQQVAEVTELAMQGKLDFAQSLHQRVATLAGAPESILATVAENIPLMPGLTELVNTLKTHQWKVAIASGGFTYFADHLKSLLALDAAYANVLEITNEKLTGKVLGQVVDAKIKAQCLTHLQQEYQLPSKQTVAMGDGANDLTMMSAAHLGVAFHAKPIVLKQADTSINHQGLDCLLHWLA